MKRFLVAAALGLVLWFGASPTAAQITRSDSAAVLLGVVQRLQADGRTELASSLLDLILERYAGTAAAAEAQRLRGALRAAPEERSGKTELLVFTTGYGLALGVVVPLAFDLDEPEAFGVGLITGGPAGYLLGRAILRSRPITEGQARAISFGTLWGGWQGLGWTDVMNLGQGEQCSGDVCTTSDPDDEALMRGLLFGSLTGLATGAYLARKNIPAGTASAVNLGALWGTWYGYALAELADLDGDDNFLTAALVGGNAGLVGTALLAPRWNLSRGRARLISITGLAGLLAGAGGLLIAQPDSEDDDVIIGTLLATSGAGLALGTYWTRNYDERAQPAGDPGAEALLDLRAGTWSINMPEPGLRMIETRVGGRPAYRPGLAVPLLRAVF
jgi:hypothetical protein